MTEPIQITEPGVYEMTAATYHADPVDGGSLSSTGARKLLPPSCPALFQHERQHGTAPRKVWDLGHAAHKVVLGTGPDLVLIDRERWDTNAVKAEVAAVREAGGVPLKRSEYEQVHAMAAALREHPIASALLRPEGGKAEQALFWIDPETGIWCRALVDFLPHAVPGRRLLAADYKTCVSAAPDDIQKAIHDHGYYLQDDWYRGGIRALELAADVAFLFVFQMKTAPYLVTVAEVDPTGQAIGAHQNRLARLTYQQCTTTGRWPGWTDDVALVSLPGWIEKRYAKEVGR